MAPIENMPQAKSESNRSEAWPFYIVCDVSQSMHAESFSSSWGSPTSPWKMMNIELASLIDALEDEPEASDVAHVAAVQFSGEAKSVSKLAVVSSMPRISELDKGTWTNYVGVWKFLASLIPSDMEPLRKSGREIGRPTIFFITDGNPGGKNEVQTSSDWQVHLTALNRAMAPIEPRVIAIGLGDVNRQTLLDLHSKNPHGAAVIAAKNGEASTLVNPVITQIKNSIANSTSSGAFSWTPPKGMINLCNETRH